MTIQPILFAAFFAAACIVCSCNRDNSISETSEVEKAPDIQAASDDSSDVKPPLLSAEEQEAELLDELISCDKTTDALRHARNLMDSTNVNIRVRVVEALGWIGRRAIPEISEMMNDKSPAVAEQALTAWEQAFAEIDKESRQASVAVETAAMLKNPDQITSVLLHMADIEQSISLPALADFIENGRGNVASECARDVYKHITGGEVYESPESTRAFLRQEQTQSINNDKGDVK